MESRTKNSFFNIVSNIFIMSLRSLLTFVTRTVFIYTLGETALGLNGLFSNILSMLSLAELGVNVAINFSLYKSLANNDYDEISALMNFYKKIYRLVGLIILTIGILIVPFLEFFITDIESINGVYIIYFLYLINTISIYFIGYKETLIIADQKNYKLTKINIGGLFILNTLQIIFLLVSHSFIVYLLVQVIIQFLQMIVINIYVTREYNYIDFKSNKKISSNNLHDIIKNVKAMFLHKIGDYCINGTDNLIISKFINISTVGVYSNYLMIVGILNNFVSNGFNAVISSLGNLVISENEKRKEEVFNNLNFIAFILYSSCALGMLNCFTPFIKLWIGSKYLLPIDTTILIVLNFYFTGMRVPVQSMKTAAGLFDVDKYTPIIQSILNLVVSIVLVKKIGLNGVLLGTLVSSLLLPCWQRPVILYQIVFNKKPSVYFRNYFKQLVILILSAIFGILVSSMFMFDNLFISFIFNGVIIELFFFVLVVIFYFHTSEFKYIFNLIKRRNK